MKDARKTILFCIWITALIFISACGSSGSQYPDISTSTVETRKTTVSPMPSSTIMLEDIQSEGALVLACSGGLFQYNFEDMDFSVLDGDVTRVYSYVDWNPDGIFYTRTTNKPTEQVMGTGGQHGPDKIFWIKAGRSASEQLTLDEYYDFRLDVSPRPGYVVYVSDRPEFESLDRYKLILLNTNDQTEKVLLASPHQFLPVFSPLGNRIVALETLPPSEGKAGLYLFDLNQDTQIQLLSDKDISYRGITWSPDQKYVAIGVKGDNGFSIDFVNVDTGIVDKAISLENEPGDLAWSPDGEKILFETRMYLNTGEVSIQLLLYDIVHDQVKELYIGGIDGRPYGYHALWSSNDDVITFFIDNEDKMLGQNLIIKNLVTLDEFSVETPCSPVRSAIWVD
jgi:Tol biopolymer transport system component